MAIRIDQELGTIMVCKSEHMQDNDLDTTAGGPEEKRHSPTLASIRLVS
jgi:hypothetical protein